MPIAVTTTDSWHDTKRLHVVGTLVFSGTYPTGGDTLNFQSVKGVLSSLPPVWCDVQGQAGFKYEFATGTTIANGKVLVRVEAAVGTNTPLAEHTNVAYVAGVTGDTVDFHAIFKLR